MHFYLDYHMMVTHRTIEENTTKKNSTTSCATLTTPICFKIFNNGINGKAKNKNSEYRCSNVHEERLWEKSSCPKHNRNVPTSKCKGRTRNNINLSIFAFDGRAGMSTVTKQGNLGTKTRSKTKIVQFLSRKNVQLLFEL